MLAFAILEKVPVVFFGLVVIYLYIDKLRAKVLKNIDFYAYGVIALLPAIIYFAYLKSVSYHSFVSEIAFKHIFSSKFLNIFTLDTLNYHLKIFKNDIGMELFIVCILAIIYIAFNNPKKKLLLSWLIVMFIEMVIVCGIIKFNYYFCFIVPIVIAFSVIFIDSVFNSKGKFFILLAIFSVYFCIGLNVVDKELVENKEITNYSKIVKQNTSDNLVALNATDPTYINALDRYGTRLGLKYYDKVPKQAEKEVEYWEKKGIKEFVLFKSCSNFNEFNDVMKDKMTVAYEDEKIIVYV